MEQIIRTYKKEIEVHDTITLCDRCKQEIEDPRGFGKEHNYIILDSDLNYPEHGGNETKYELCSDCF